MLLGARSTLSAAIVLSLFSLGCDTFRGCGVEKIAELVQTKNKVQRDYASKQGSWKKANTGDSFIINDGVRTARGSSAKIMFTSGSGVKLGELTRIRFLSKAPGRGDGRISVEAGEVVLEGGGGGLQLNTYVGVAYIEAGSQVEVQVNGDKMKFLVLVGQASIEGADSLSFGAGQGVVLEVGGAILERLGGDETEEPIEEPPAEEPSSDTVEVNLKGRAARVRAPGEKSWSTVEPGSIEVVPGSEIKIPRGATVEIRRAGQFAEVKGLADIVVAPEGGALLKADRGTLSAEATGEAVQVALPGGEMVALGSGSTGVSNIEVGGRYSDITVRNGNAQVKGKDASVDLLGGEKVRLTHSGMLEVLTKIPKYADFSMPAGESATVHDTSAPTAIRILFEDKCNGEGMVEVGSNRAFSRLLMSSPGKGSAIISANPGSLHYRLRCMRSGGTEASKAVASGTIRVSRDAGSQQIPKRAPRNTVEADGRKYTVLYQNLLPELSFIWSRAPKGGSYTLRLEPQGSGSSKTVTANAAKYTFDAGEVAEGTYNWWFESKDGKRSATTALSVAFDNAAPAAFLREPSGTIPAGSASVTVSGAAVDGAKVSVRGTPLQTDSQYRFKGDVGLSGDERSVAIRISQAQYGVHYYLRSIAQ
ncbi:MAG: FecR domain-containing protein [Myxococcales bacterium]|nr:MAG: FecR domain-containing protein [Myxococcales bacterium]